MLPAVQPATTRGSSDASARRCIQHLGRALDHPGAAAGQVSGDRQVGEQEYREREREHDQVEVAHHRGTCSGGRSRDAAQRSLNLL